MKPTLAIDFDGVLHGYRNGWQGGTIYDLPVDGAIEAWGKLKSLGFNLVVFTARVDLEPVEAWMEKWFGEKPLVTNQKPLALFYIDDRALTFRNWPDMMATLSGFCA